MKVDLRDREILNALRPSELAAYLRARGWRETNESINTPWASFTLADYEIAIPLTLDLRDYAPRVADALKTLELVEERDQIQILADLSTSSADVIRIQILDPEASNGTLPLDRALEVVNNAHSMMLAAACTTVAPKLYYPARKPALATEYMRNVRMGQTERGSFVVTVLSRVAPDLIPSDQAQELGIPEPFERRVTVKLSEALAAVTNAATHAIATGSLDQFEASVERGVSANLCNAMSGLGRSEYGPRPVAIDITWARTRAVPPPPRQRTIVTSDLAPVLQEAALLLKTKTPREEFEVRGFVFRLRADPPGAHAGEITVAADVDGEQKSIWLDLKGEDYRLAAEAHAARRLFGAIGILKKEGRSYRLLSHHSIRVIDVEE